MVYYKVIIGIFLMILLNACNSNSVSFSIYSDDGEKEIYCYSAIRG
jgi:hypothetical protein